MRIVADTNLIVSAFLWGRRAASAPRRRGSATHRAFYLRVLKTYQNIRIVSAAEALRIIAAA